MLVLITAQAASFVSSGEGKKCNVFADTITIKVPSEMTGGEYSISEDITPAGQGAPPHIHRRELETFIVLEGDYEVPAADRKLNATEEAMAVPQSADQHA